MNAILDYNISDYSSMEEPFEYQNLLFVPVYFRNQPFIRGFKAQFRNLEIFINKNGDRIKISNSLHKFHLGNNNSDFTRTNIESAIQELSDYLHIDVSRARITKLEYGCNIHNIGFSMSENILLMYHGHAFHPMTKDGQCYGQKADFQQYSIKGYDKTKQLKMAFGMDVHDDIWRWEISVKKMAYLFSKVKAISTITLKDLSNPKLLGVLSNDLVCKYRNCQKDTIEDLKCLTLKEKTIRARMIDPRTRLSLQTEHPDTYKKDLKIYQKICKEAPGTIKMIEKLILEKSQFLATA